ncbi:hypothetical protein [Lentibacillus sp. Marseille-P4043]|uniref:hypothetical protein n=1 Tax=Lentibacillus sp. Marseille-P4043 TaxID=2040293 RepID=UPI00131A4B00|nr:hypothetical protein [Lentibacillus sp. Marseille-P4043]
MKAETSAREQKHRRESRNISARAETSAREQKHRRKSRNISPNPRNIDRNPRKHQPEPAKYQLERTNKRTAIQHEKLSVIIFPLPSI